MNALNFPLHSLKGYVPGCISDEEGIRELNKVLSIVKVLGLRGEVGYDVIK